MNLMQGYKTYILALVAVIYAIAGFYSGHIAGQDAVNMMWAALTAGALRHGIANA